MNETGNQAEAELIFRRLGDPFPPVPDAPSWLPEGASWMFDGVLLLLAGAALLGWLVVVYLCYRSDTRSVGGWAYVTGALRLLGVGFLAAAAAFRGASIPQLEQFGDNVAWYLAIIALLLTGLSFIVSSYLRDARNTGWLAIPLGVLRLTVYLLLAWAFLLPAIQKWETTRKTSKVIVILDVSPSVAETADELSSIPGRKAKTRLDKVIDFLTDEQVAFLKKLLDKNPVAVYRFGSRLDEDAQTFDAGRPVGWAKEDWYAWARYDFKPYVLRGVSPDGRNAVRQSRPWDGDKPGTPEWALAWAKLKDEEAIPAGLSEADQKALAENKARLEKRVDVARSIVQGTNVPDSLTALVSREAANMVQGVVVFSDGRSNLGSDSAYRQLREKATRDKIPIVTVAVGEPREVVSITITDLQAPDRAPPDEAFKVAVEADGVGLGDEEVDVRLELFLPGRDPKKDPPDHVLVNKLKFQGDTNPPHGVAEFVVDAEAKDPTTGAFALPEALTEPSKKIGRTRQLRQGQWAAIAKIARDRREVFPDADHVSPARPIQVIDKPLRVLLFGGSTREHQTIRTLLARETDQNRAELSICLQNEAGRSGQAVLDVPPERILTRFPDRLDTTSKPTDKPEDKFYNLNEYDLVVAFDPDWNEKGADGQYRIDEQSIKNLQSWVDNLGGGLIYVAGTHHTYQLARADESGRLKPLLDILPVLPDDIILVQAQGVSRNPRRLTLRPHPEFDVLKLTEDESSDPIGGWELFFSNRDKYAPDTDVRKNVNPERGFFSYYPVKGNVPKPGATVLAEMLTVDDNAKVTPVPWLVTTQPARGRTVFLGSGEIWRLRARNADFYDRFWVKVSRYAAANRDVKATRGRVLVGKEFTSGSQVRVQARLLAPNGAPYPMDAMNPKFVVHQVNPAGEVVNKQGPYELKAKKGGGDFDGYYAGQVLADPNRFPPGDSKYRVVVDVPDSPGDVLTAEFSLKRSDPELDNTRPDLAALEQAAGNLEEVKGRIKDPVTLEKVKGAEREAKNVKLAYKLSDTDKLAMVPEFFETIPRTDRNRGPVEDVWDKPVELSPGVRLLEFTAFGQTISIGWLLLTVVLLLSIEWLTRKLVRLA
jgi:hypothetical protein